MTMRNIPVYQEDLRDRPKQFPGHQLQLAEDGVRLRYHDQK